jgi:Mg/Co/Ni transporter MgtE
MDDEKASELFDLMEEDEKVDVAELMTYEKNTAGGLMTTELVTFPKSMKAANVLSAIRENAETPDMIYYVFVVEKTESKKLCGVTTLRSIILADKNATLENIMREEFRSAKTDDPATEVALRIAEYNLLALPVVDDEKNILGIVTVDDAMEILLPKHFE